MDESGRGVDFLQMEPSGEEIGPGRRPGGDRAAGIAGEGGLPSGKLARGRRPEVYLKAADQRDGGHHLDGDLLPVHLPPRTGGAAGARAPGSDDRGFGADVGGSISQTGVAAPRGDCAAAGGVGFQVSRQERPSSPCLPPPFTLSNDGNACYMNAVVYAVWYAAHCTQTVHLLPRAVAALSGLGMRARRSLGFLLLGWQGAGRQHDIAEFIDFLLPKVAPMGSTWSSRALTPAGEVSTRHTGTLCKCLGLPAPPVHRPDLQELINCWHQQESLHALDVPPPWLFVQLPRFEVISGRVCKTNRPYILAGAVRLPTFSEPGTFQVTWHTYNIACYIRHHGRTPHSGHYTVLVNSRQPYLLDDDRTPAAATAEELEDTSVSAYVLLLCRSIGPETHSASSESFGPSFPCVAAVPSPAYAGDRKLHTSDASYARDLAQQPSGVLGDLASSIDVRHPSAPAEARSARGAHPKADNQVAAYPSSARPEQGHA